ncbi:MAG: hypothetical protein GAK40_01040 [Burkholderia plantarii]|nr:MAG: hypothetical protein GAK40_01040 [Burkholderia plantarii]
MKRWLAILALLSSSLATELACTAYCPLIAQGGLSNPRRKATRIWQRRSTTF